MSASSPLKQVCNQIDPKLHSAVSLKRCDPCEPSREPMPRSCCCVAVPQRCERMKCCLRCADVL